MRLLHHPQDARQGLARLPAQRRALLHLAAAHLPWPAPRPPPAAGWPLMRWVISLVSLLDRSASLRTSAATTVKPLPCSPARAASMAAFRASRLVWLAMSSMASTIWPISWLLLAQRRHLLGALADGGAHALDAADGLGHRRPALLGRAGRPAGGAASPPPRCAWCRPAPPAGRRSPRWPAPPPARWASAPPATCSTAAFSAVICSMAAALSLLCSLVPRATSSMDRAIWVLACPTCWVACASWVAPLLTCSEERATWPIMSRKLSIMVTKACPSTSSAPFGTTVRVRLPDARVWAAAAISCS